MKSLSICQEAEYLDGVVENVLPETSRFRGNPQLNFAKNLFGSKFCVSELGSVCQNLLVKWMSTVQHSDTFHNT